VRVEQSIKGDGADSAVSTVSGRSEDFVEDDGVVRVSHVLLHSPLSENLAPHAEGMSQLGYLRYRSADGPQDALAADAILVIQPGNLAAPHSLDGVARGVIASAAERGLAVEFWALARRTEGLDDAHGILAALDSGEPDLALSYYLGGGEVGGRTFAGLRNGADMSFLSEFGFSRVVNDTFELLSREIPDPALRQQRVFLGGHSGGASVIAAFGSWDFDGTPGHEMCRALIALDTPMDCDFGLRSNDALRALAAPWTLVAGLAYPLAVGALRNRRFPVIPGRLVTLVSYVNRLLGLYAFLTPDTETALLRRIRDLLAGTEFERPFQIMLRALYSTSFRQALTGKPDPLGYRMTSLAEFGTWLGSGFAPNPARIGIGSLEGPLGTRDFPAPAWLWRIPLVRSITRFAFGDSPLARPTDRNHLYRWSSSSARDFAVARSAARMMAGGPRSAFEPYHATRFLVDQLFALIGARTGDLAQIKHERGMRATPLLSIFQSHVPLAPRIPFMNVGEAHVIPGGYSHVDVVAANGGPNRSAGPVAALITEFVQALTATGAITSVAVKKFGS
jgi:hypothetical protein